MILQKADNVEQPAVSQSNKRPIGLKWRCSYWFTTIVVTFGIAVDLLVYSILIPVIPFQLERLHYTRVSALTGWLLFAYSGGLVLSTVPIAMLSERYRSRRWPLILGIAILIGSQVMFMEAPIYAVMCVARILQGIGSSMVWVVGLALLCDNCPQRLVGRQLGIAMAGLSIGVLVGPPVGGALYIRFGFRGPFIFGIVTTVFDLFGRLLIIERKHALIFGVDSASITTDDLCVDGTQTSEHQKREPEVAESPRTPGPEGDISVASATTLKPLSLLTVVTKLMESSRALVALVITFLYGIVYGSQEPAVPLHLQSVWNLSPGKVGLVFIAAVLPTLFSSPLAGIFSDKNGTALVTCVSLGLALPWWVIIIIRKQLALFIVAFAMQSFFTSGVISPLTAELAAVSREFEGIGYAHVYGAFSLAYGLGTSFGPVIGGQMYDKLEHGWTALCLLATGLLAVALILSFCFTGEEPLLRRVIRN